MKDQDIILKIQAFVDGELVETEQTAMAALAARDPDISDLVKELKQTRQALAAYDETLELPESREFFWSKVQRRIESLPVEIDEPQRRSLPATLIRWFAPAACLAALVVAGFVMMGDHGSNPSTITWQASYEDVNAFTYRDYEEGMTLLWLSYPADKAVAKSDEAVTIN